MWRLINRICLWLRNETLKLVLLAGVILLIWGTFAPVGTLIWWLNQGSRSPATKRNRFDHPASDRTTSVNRQNQSSAPDCYIVFLTGVGDFSANQLDPGEEQFLDRLVKQHPDCVAVRDVFPYSAANESLGGQRLLAPLWSAANQAHGWLSNADVIIKIRNLWRFAISIDNRYGAVYNKGIASAIIKQMEVAYPLTESRSPLKLILIGTSGGAQVALGASKYLDQWLKTQLIVVSVGGDFSGTEGFNAADHVYHLRGRNDWIEDISRIVFPSRWPWTVGSPFNQARRQGRYTVENCGPQHHSGANGYFGLTPVKKGSNTTYLDLTLRAVNQLPIWGQNR